jgi:ketosteroid isomerase-like protein
VIRAAARDESSVATSAVQGDVAMSADVNSKVVDGIYDAFRQGDVDAILEVVTDDVDWQTEAVGEGAPWWGPHEGKDGVRDFFVGVGSTMVTDEFTVLAQAASDTDVLTVVKFVAHVAATGRSISMELHHQFTFRDGKVSHYRGSEDTQQTAAALAA